MTVETDTPPRAVIGRPPRPVPDNVMALTTAAYQSGRIIGIPLPPDTTVDDVDAFRLDVRAAARRLGGDRVMARISGRTESGLVISVDRRARRELWPDLVALYVTVRRIGAAS